MADLTQSSFQFQSESLYQDKDWLNLDFMSEGELIYKDFLKENKIIGHAIIKKRKIRFTPFYSLRITFGPALDYTNDSDVRLVFSELHNFCKMNGSMFIEIHPFTNVNTFVVTSILEEFQFKRTKNYIYESTILIDLNRSEEILFADFEQRGREAVRQSERRGITSSQAEITETNLEVFYEMYSQTCKRSGMIPDSKSDIFKITNFFGKRGKAFLFFANYENKPVSGFIAFKCGDCLSLIYQGSDYSNNNQNKRPANNLYWETMKWAKINQYKWFDLAGITIESEPESKKTGIKNFKLQFGGKLVSFPGNYRFINRPLIFTLYSMFLPLYSMISMFRMKRI